MIERRNSMTTVTGFGWMTDIGWADDTLGLGRSGPNGLRESEFR